MKNIIVCMSIFVPKTGNDGNYGGLNVENKNNDLSAYARFERYILLAKIDGSILSLSKAIKSSTI